MPLREHFSGAPVSTSVVPLFSGSPCEFSGAAVMPLREHFSGAPVNLVVPL